MSLILRGEMGGLVSVPAVVPAARLSAPGGAADATGTDGNNMPRATGSRKDADMEACGCRASLAGT